MQNARSHIVVPMYACITHCVMQQNAARFNTIVHYLPYGSSNNKTKFDTVTKIMVIFVFMCIFMNKMDVKDR